MSQLESEEVRRQGRRAHADISWRVRERERWTDREEKARTKSSSFLARKRWCDREMEG